MGCLLLMCGVIRSAMAATVVNDDYDYDILNIFDKCPCGRACGSAEIGYFRIPSADRVPSEQILIEV